MKKRLLYTPNSLITTMLRRLFMWSRERRNVLARAKIDSEHYYCEVGKHIVHKGEINVHHRHLIDWQSIRQAIRDTLLNEKDMVCVCKECHKEEHEGDK